MLRSLLAQLLPRTKPPVAGRAPDAAPAPSPLEEPRRLLAARALDEAEAAVGAVLAAEPENAEALVLRAGILRRLGRLEAAMDAYRRALVLNPRNAEAWLDLGVCHFRTGDNFWARVYFRFARALDPDNADVLNEQGLIDIALGNFESAEESLDNAVNRNPDHPEAWNNLGLVVARRGDLGAARRNFLRATFLKADYYMAFCNLGLVCRDLELLEDAEKALRRAVEIDPEAATAWLNLGMVLQDQDRLEEALEALERARGIAPSDVDVLAGLGALWLRRGDGPRALETAELGLRLDPKNNEARLALAHAQLALGRFEEGWSNYEARLSSNASPLRPLLAPRCTGAADLAGKTVLVQREQGLGDEIMFASCLPEFVRLGAKCIVHCDRRLEALFRRSFPQVEVVGSVREFDLPQGAASRALDCRMPIGSLPEWYRRTMADFDRAQPFLRADPEKAARWRERLAGLGAGPKIGIAWRGGLYKTGRVRRSLSLEAMLPALRVEGLRWVNLQHRDHLEELEQMRARHGVQIGNWDEALSDLDETAALIANLDLVITVCSTVVHLTGALGRPVWTLTPFAPAWRYLHQGERMPWYADVRLIRQRSESGWGAVVEEVVASLHERFGGTARGG
jgi:tetratricopeptide (TPR) repeat protein